ncbi:MAG: SUMF1/EgtB/PvdO family nonheme iron enzyme [Flavobacteriales bacterium]|nr:SUMF1/EgtB/PvdO family nonheme iron enzyme [Flavobacteriales bacterium]
MKNIALSLMVIAPIFATAQKATDFTKVLPGVVKVTENLYYDATEITNMNWLEYLNWLKGKTGGKASNAYQTALPDSTVWKFGLEKDSPYLKYYFRHVAYQSYPVVGVSWQQASEYCAWRTERVAEYLEANGKREKAPPYFAYRLPTEEEFKLMYDNMVQYPDFVGAEGKRKFLGMSRYNMKREMDEFTSEVGDMGDHADVTAPVKSYWPNDFGVYNIRGNVTEWLMQANSHAGGSWMDSFADDVRSVTIADAPSARIGFRCVCEVSTESP